MSLSETEKWWRKHKQSLEIEPPGARCGGCGFTTALTGKFLVEDGLLVWRGAPDPQPGRGPHLEHCGEGADCPEQFAFITADGRDLSPGEVRWLRQSAADARKDDW